MALNTDGLVIKEQNIGEADRLVTVLTREEGLVRAFVRGAKQLKSRLASSTGLLCYSRFSIYKGRDKYIIDEAEPLEVFFDLRSDIEKLALAQYFCELTLALAPEGVEAGDFLRLLLNALYFLAKEKRPRRLIKAAFEMRILSLAGYMPNLICCEGCGEYEADEMFFVPRSGLLYCAGCYKKADTPTGIVMGRGVTTALRHTIYAEFQKLFSFRLPEEGQKALSFISEQYVLNRLERGFKTLDFYRQIALPGDK